MLLSNHGVLVVGKDIGWTVLAAITLERAARLQAIARTLGTLRPISQRLAAELHPLKYQDRFVAEYWEAWLRRLPPAVGES